MLVLHYTGMPNGRAALERLCSPAAKVSAHYLIEEDGAVFALVEEDRRAWHAGVSAWRGNSDINARSIGIELVNPGHEFGYRAFPDSQMAALAALVPEILARHPIPRRNVVGHSDVAPDRKEDPGELFDWEWLAERGIGAWPASTASVALAPSDREVTSMLRKWGYQFDDDPSKALVAFQRHFRPAKFDGVADAETVSRLAGLLAKFGDAA
jgi:N-acetylmuramoyl-L-alanine amidase